MFSGDSVALEAGKQRIRQEFSKNRHEVDPKKIAELIQIAEDTERILRCHVVQGVQTNDGNYQLKITRDTALEENAPLPKKTQ